MSSKHLIFIAIVSLSIQACDKIAKETDPAEIILGKWRTVEIGNWPNMFSVQDDGYIEYLPDSTKVEYAPDLDKNTYKTYWVDSLVHEVIYNDIEDKRTIIFNYKYEFYNKNKSMRLNITIPAMNKTSIYKRIK
jgi:hypothetical protein